jgi:hypothetical protein
MDVFGNPIDPTFKPPTVKIYGSCHVGNFFTSNGLVLSKMHRRYPNNAVKVKKSDPPTLSFDHITGNINNCLGRTIHKPF